MTGQVQESTPREQVWRAAIADWLLGRFSKNISTEALPLAATATLTRPVIGWWLFEGWTCPLYGGPICKHWGRIAANAETLLRAWTSRHRVTDRPEGVVDWGKTLALGHSGVIRDFVCGVSGVGLSEEERTTLVGWGGWILDEWESWSRAIGCDSTDELRADVLRKVIPAGSTPPSINDDVRMTRWSHVAARSRFPLFRDVIAPTLDIALNPTRTIDKLPIPSERHALFQLYVVVCICRELAPRPLAVRWLPPISGHKDEDGMAGRLEVPGHFSVYYERHLKQNEVLQPPLFPPHVADALKRQGVLKQGQRADILIEPSVPHAWPWRCMLVEVKSGNQRRESALFQMLAYGNAFGKVSGKPIIVWGIGESDDWSQQSLVDAIGVEAGHDAWMFSGPDDVSVILRKLGLSNAIQ